MIEFAVTVQGQKITCTKLRGELVSGLVGVKVHFTWSGEWQQLRRIAVFRAGGISRNVMDLENQCEIPWEVLVEPGQALMVGIQGTNEEGTAVTPTLEAEMGEILPGADPSDDPTAKPTLPMWKWLKNLVEKTVEKIDQLLHGGQEEIDRVAADGRAEIDAIATQLNGMIQDGNVIVQPAQDGEARTAIQNHTNDKNNPHGVKPAQIGAMATSGGVFTGAVTMNGLRLTKKTDYGMEVPENMEEGKVFLVEDSAEDYIEEQGVSEIGWYYRKWHNGTAECWMTAERTILAGDWKGDDTFLSYGLYWTSGINLEVKYPFTFASHPVETACLTNSTVWLPLSLISTTHGQSDKTDSYRLCTYKKPDQDIRISVAFHIVGSWK